MVRRWGLGLWGYWISRALAIFHSACRTWTGLGPPRSLTLRLIEVIRHLATEALLWQKCHINFIQQDMIITLCQTRNLQLTISCTCTKSSWLPVKAGHTVNRFSTQDMTTSVSDEDKFTADLLQAYFFVNITAHTSKTCFVSENHKIPLAQLSHVWFTPQVLCTATWKSSLQGWRHMKSLQTTVVIIHLLFTYLCQAV